jgi:hypothetical protein
MADNDNNRPIVVGIFDDRGAAEQAVDDLEYANFKDEDIGFVIRGSEAVRGGMITDAQGTKDRKGALTGMAVGGTVGALIGAASAMIVPGIGPVVAGGILASAFGGAIAGVATGGILGAMMGLGISEEEAQFYERAFNEGKAIVAVRAGTRFAEAGDILRRHGGYDIETRRQSPIRTEGIFTQP